jgi:ABC-2 type transport system ATP-binding protein
MIKTEDLTKKYGGVTALNLPDLMIPAGERFGLVGNNGAGKTTFFSLILDLIEATTGNVCSKERPVAQSDHWKSYTGAFLDEHFLIDFLTPEEYFKFIAGLHRMTREQFSLKLAEFEDFFNGEILRQKKYIRALSRGNQKKIGIAAALFGDPKVVILDEPFPHLDPSSVIRLKKILRGLAVNHETTLLISSHDLNHVTEVCERIVILEKGEIVHDLRTDNTTLEKLNAYFDPIRERA